MHATVASITRASSFVAVYGFRGENLTLMLDGYLGWSGPWLSLPFPLSAAFGALKPHVGVSNL